MSRGKKSKFKMGVCVVVPSNGRRPPLEWALAIATMSYPLGMNHAWFISKKDPKDEKFTRDQQREMLAEKCLAVGAEYMLTLDDDTIPPAHVIQSLWSVLAQNPKVAVCGGIYVSKDKDFPVPLVFKDLGGGVMWEWTLGEVFPCAGIGTGCMMVRLSAFKDIPKPWFKDSKPTDEYDRTQSATVGDIKLNLVENFGTDDLYFCKKVSEAGWGILAHGGVLALHVDQDDKSYMLPENSYPVQSYMKKRQALTEMGMDPTNKKNVVTETPGKEFAVGVGEEAVATLVSKSKSEEVQ